MSFIFLRDMNLTKTLAWSDEEHNILVQRTNEQIELEAKDSSKTISWAQHFRNVSLCLSEHGFSRSKNACQTYYWRRVIQPQDINAPSSKGDESSESSATYCSLEDSSNKRPLQETEICNEDPTLPSKKPCIDEPRPEAVDKIPERLDVSSLEQLVVFQF
jgi:hypothetical protein